MKKTISRASGEPVNITNLREYAKEYDEQNHVMSIQIYDDYVE